MVKHSEFSDPWIAFAQGVRTFGVSLSSAQLAQFSRFFTFLSERCRQFNLTAITEEREVLVKHFLDSLAVVPFFTEYRGEKILDVGTGGGFPGIPLKVIYPELQLTLLEASRKKVTYLTDLVQTLGLSGVQVIWGRAEELARGKLRETFRGVVARALAPLAITYELCFPFVASHGSLFVWKGPKGLQELKEMETRNVVPLLGGEQGAHWQGTLPETPFQRCLIHFRKTAQTPEKYPRPYAEIKRRPLAF